MAGEADAKLRIVVDSTEAIQSTKRVRDELGKSGQEAQRFQRATNTAMASVAASMGRAAQSAKQLRGTTRELRDESKQVAGAFRQLAQGATGVQGAMARMASQGAAPARGALAQLSGGMASAKAQAASLRAGVGELTRGFGGLEVAAAGAAAVIGGPLLAGLASLQAAKAAGNIQAIAEQTNTATTAIQQYSTAATAAGVKTDKVRDALRDLNTAIGEARAGTGALFTDLKALDAGLAQQVRAAENTGAAFRDVLTAIRGYENRARAAAVASTAFSASAVPAVLEVAKAMDSAAQRALRFETVLSDKLVARGAAVESTLSTIGNAIVSNFQTGVLRAFGNEFQNLAQTVQSAAVQQDIRAIGRATGNLFQTIANAGDDALAALTAIGRSLDEITPALAAGALAGAVQTITRLGGVASAAAAGVRSLAAAFLALPGSRLVKLVGLAAGAIAGLSSDSDKAASSLRNNLAPGADTAAGKLDELQTQARGARQELQALTSSEINIGGAIQSGQQDLIDAAKQKRDQFLQKLVANSSDDAFSRQDAAAVRAANSVKELNAALEKTNTVLQNKQLRALAQRVIRLEKRFGGAAQAANGMAAGMGKVREVASDAAGANTKAASTAKKFATALGAVSTDAAEMAKAIHEGRLEVDALAGAFAEFEGVAAETPELLRQSSAGMDQLAQRTRPVVQQQRRFNRLISEIRVDPLTEAGEKVAQAAQGIDLLSDNATTAGDKFGELGERVEETSGVIQGAVEGAGSDIAETLRRELEDA